MYASTPTKLTLARFARNLGLSPLHLGQVAFTPADARYPPSSCDNVFVQYEWQAADAVSREEIARAIADAETLIENELGFRLLPSWEVDEWHPLIRPNQAELFNLNGRELRGFAAAIKADYGWLLAGGRRSVSSLGLAAPIVWSDPDGDGYKETGTVTLAVAATVSEDEVSVFYPGHQGDPRYEIRPVAVSIAAGTATITFRRELAVREALIEELSPEAVPGGDDALFLATVDVGRVFNNPADPADLLWENPAAGCGDTSCYACSFTTATACLNIRGDPRLGWFSYEPATYDAASDSFTAALVSACRAPETIRLNYLAGYREKSSIIPDFRPTRDLAAKFEVPVTLLAASMLDRPPCTCLKETWERWAVDLAFSGGAEETASYQLSQSDLACPWGTRRGAVLAWRRIKNAREVLPRVAIVD